jgi:hypothetical protein
MNCSAVMKLRFTYHKHIVIRQECRPNMRGAAAVENCTIITPLATEKVHFMSEFIELKTL